MKKIQLIIVLFWASTALSAQTSLEQFYANANAFFEENVAGDRVNYAAIKASPKALNALTDFIATANVSNNTATEQKAYYINAYNLLVIKTVVEHYPIKQPTEVIGFFDRIKQTVGGKKYTLNNLEQKELLTKYKDARLHFVLVCAAVSCPPVANFAYRPNTLEEQLDERTKAAMNDTTFIQYDDFNGKAEISEIFKWYVDDFKPNVKAFITQYRKNPLDAATKISYYPYNWTLNDLDEITVNNGTAITPPTADDNGFQPIIVAATMPKGKYELNTFHSIYTANYQSSNAKYSGYTGLFFFSYGVNGKFDLGWDFILKSSRFGDKLNRSPFLAMDFQRGVDSTSQADGQQVFRDYGLSHLGPRVRVSPFKKLPITIEQAIYFPISGLPAGNQVDPALYWVTQIYYDHQFTGGKFSLFGALTFWQPIRTGEPFKFQVPYLKFFFTWFTTKRFTLYATTTSLTEWGGGAKFLLTPQFEIQAMYTYYVPIPGLSTIYVGEGASQVQTFNIGLRYRI